MVSHLRHINLSCSNVINLLTEKYGVADVTCKKMFSICVMYVLWVNRIKCVCQLICFT